MLERYALQQKMSSFWVLRAASPKNADKNPEKSDIVHENTLHVHLLCHFTIYIWNFERLNTSGTLQLKFRCVKPYMYVDSVNGPFSGTGRSLS